MQMRNWFRKGMALLLATIIMVSVLPLSALAESYTAVVTASETKVYQEYTMTGVYATVSKGTVLTVKGTKNGIAQVSRNGYIGYVYADDLAAQNGESANETPINRKVVLTAPLTVYAKASTSAKKAVTPAGTEITIVAEGANNWLKLNNKGYIGYARKADVEAATQQTATAAPTATPTAAPTATPTAAPQNEPIAVIVTKQATVYAKASTDSAVLGRVYAGEQLNCIDVSGNWAKIDKNGNQGWMLKGALIKAEDAQPTATPTAAPTATPAPTATAEPENDPIPCTVIADTVVVYEKASTSAAILGRLKKGEHVDVVGVSGNWAKIKKDGHVGYCLKGGLTPTADLQQEPAQQEVKFTATVISGSMTIYKSASTKSDKLTSVSRGATVNVYEGGSTWAKISYGDTYGYAQISHMSARSYSTYASGDSGNGVKELNQLLLAKGYYDAVPGTSYNSATVSAVKRLQGELGLTQSGEADITLMRLLNEASDIPSSPLLNASLANGSKGADVERLQTRLHALGYLSKSSSIDADYGNTTANAVKLFQKTTGISETGKADNGTIKKLYAANAASLPSGTNPADQSSSTSLEDPGSTDNSPLSASGQAKVETIIEYGTSKLGCRYVYGTSGPTTFDCSGFTLMAYKQAGITLARSAYNLGYGSAGAKIAYSGLVRGDIVCFDTISDSDLSDHVGIYLGSGKFIHASSGKGEVVISDMTSGYYNRVFSWGKRFIN